MVTGCWVPRSWHNATGILHLSAAYSRKIEPLHKVLLETDQTLKAAFAFCYWRHENLQGSVHNGKRKASYMTGHIKVHCFLNGSFVLEWWRHSLQGWIASFPPGCIPVCLFGMSCIAGGKKKKREGKRVKWLALTWNCVTYHTGSQSWASLNSKLTGGRGWLTSAFEVPCHHDNYFHLT